MLDFPSSSSPKRPSALSRRNSGKPPALAAPVPAPQQPPESSYGPPKPTTMQVSPRTPPPVPRYSAFPKRHASFYSPREVPLPSPSLESAGSVFFDPSSGGAKVKERPTERQPISEPAECQQLDNAIAPPASGSGLMDASPIQFSRPADPSTSSSRLPYTLTLSTTWIDRSSSSSLPLPSQIPFYALLPATSALGEHQQLPPQHRDVPCPSLDESSPESSVGSSSFSASFRTSSSSLAPINADRHKSPPISTPLPPLRPISPFRAPQPPARDTIPPPLPTAMRPTLLQSSQMAYIPPDEPTILENEPDEGERVPAPYELFLNRAPQPADSWLQIETMQMEYRLFARLPGFSREGITLATKRRRILHLVANKWDHGGGHFERRVSFGHDADLMQVRAEFDGDMLRVSIPRRQPAWSNCRIAYSGRA